MNDMAKGDKCVLRLKNFYTIKGNGAFFSYLTSGPVLTGAGILY